MDFKTLTSIEQLSEIERQSAEKTQIIFKHSTRCSISRAALKVLTNDFPLKKDAADIWYLDLLNYRDISSEIASRYGIKHESPQILVIKDGKCVHHASHSDVNLDCV